jgi:predicted Zn finger-like uncharacterized protein
MSLPIDCPHCGKEIEINFSELKSGDTVKCKHCKKDITLTGKDIKKLSDLDKQLKSFSKDIKIKI